MLTLFSALIQVNEDLKTIGALAGLLAVPGLAVLSLLYFGQAREVRRLREWAGRAPERAAELEQRVTADAQKRAQVGVAAPATPAAQAATAAPAPTATPGNGVAKPAPGAPATVAAQAASTDGDKKDDKAEDKQAEGEEAKPEEAAAGKPAEGEEAKPEETPAEKQDEEAAKEPVGAAAGPPTTASPAATPAAATAATAAATAAARARATAPPVPPRPAQPVRANVPSATIPPRSGARRTGLGGAGASGRRSISRGGLLGLAAAVLVVGITLAIVLKVTGGSDKPAPAPNTVAGSPAEQPASGDKAAVPAVSKAQRAQTNVAVLNGTTINGLARSVASRLQDQGYTVGNVTDAPNQAQPQTKVEYGTGHRDEARALAATIKVPAARVVALGPIDSTTAGPNAEVVVVVGQDSAH
jgi:hypothetical protein